MSRIGGGSVTSIRSIKTPDGDSVFDDANNALRVNVVAGGSEGESAAKADNVAFVTADTGIPAYGVYNTQTLTNGLGAHTEGDWAPYSIDAGGNIRTALYDGNSPIATVASGGDGVNNTSRGLRVYNRNEVFNGTTYDRQRGDATNGTLVNLGSLSTFYDPDLDETAVVVKASAGTIYAIEAFNTTAAPLFLQLFNVAQGSVTVGTTAPTNQWVIPGNADSDGAGFTFNVPQGIAYGTAITAAASTGSETNGAPGSGAVIINIHYR